MLTGGGDVLGEVCGGGSGWDVNRWGGGGVGMLVGGGGGC